VTYGTLSFSAAALCDSMMGVEKLPSRKFTPSFSTSSVARSAARCRFVPSSTSFSRTGSLRDPIITPPRSIACAKANSYPSRTRAPAFASGPVSGSDAPMTISCGAPSLAATGTPIDKAPSIAISAALDMSRAPRWKRKSS